ncbi:MAG: methionine--tRNA ligase [Phycisphaerales bacterium]|nr:methionine--tRNA ligase [Phycisphaerales bacterium]
MQSKRNLLVTSALPYANGDIHIGHLVEYIQTDIWVRFQRLRGHKVTYVCGDDAHGTPVMLRARQEKLAPEQFIARMNDAHRADFALFDIGFSHYYTTHSPENQELCGDIFTRLQSGGHIATRDVEQYFDPVEGIFLPDRFIRGTCPNCKSPDQYGDSCEVCGKHYSPTELLDPRSAVSGSKPERRNSRHFFLKLNNFRDRLLELLKSGFVDEAIANKLREWFSDDLKDWDISRDAPFFGFEIPGHKDKYFYNWLDAPVGYLAALANFSKLSPAAVQDLWQDSDLEIYHFIGKDIVYFHALFWPAMLLGTGLRTPSRLCVHGHLTVNGEKMSKSRGTFISARHFAQYLDAQHLRYYFATRLTPGAADMDLNFEDFTARVNSELVGKLANLISRCAPMLIRLLDGHTGMPVVDALPMLADIRQAQEKIAAHYESRDYAAATRHICQLADRANKFVEDQAPWTLVKSDAEAARGVLTAALDAGRMLTVYLKPILPQFAQQVEKCLNLPPQKWESVEESMESHKINPFEHLTQRVDEKRILTMIEENKNQQPTAPAPAPSAVSAPAPAPVGEPLAPTCTIEQFAAIDLRVARVISAVDVVGTDKMLQLELDAGPLGKRTVFAGIKKAVKPESLPGRLVIFCANLAPRKMKFGTSEGMVLAAGPGGSDIFLLGVDAAASPGQRVH